MQVVNRKPQGERAQLIIPQGDTLTAILEEIHWNNVKQDSKALSNIQSEISSMMEVV